MHKFKNNLAHAFSLNSRSATLTICLRAFTNSPLPSPPTPHNFVTRFSFFVNLSKKYHLPPSPAPPSTRQAPANQTPLTMFFQTWILCQKKFTPPPPPKKKRKKKKKKNLDSLAICQIVTGMFVNKNLDSFSICRKISLDFALYLF